MWNLKCILRTKYQILDVGIFVFGFLFGVFYFSGKVSLDDLSSIAAIVALIFTMYSLKHSSLALSETKEQIEKSNTKSVASTFLSKLANIFETISYRQEQHLSGSSVGRAAIMEAFITMDGSHHHYFSVDLLTGYFRFYKSYLEFLVSNKEKLGTDYNVHMAAVEHDFILFKNEVRTVVGNLKVLRSSSHQYYSIDDAQKSFQQLMDFHRQYLG